MPPLNFKPLANPILILSDAPEQLTGLARIGRDLASLLCMMPEFRVGYLGKGGIGRRKFPWSQYLLPEHGQWGEEYIAPVWNDFSAGNNGIIMSTWDASRMLWFGHPVGVPAPLQKFLGDGRNYAKWGYFPVDSTGPDELGLSISMSTAVSGYDRAIAASEWGGWVLQQTRQDASWIPHGIWMDKFKPTTGGKTINTREYARHITDWESDNICVGCVMTNQARKDWPIAFEIAALLKREYGNRFHFWTHTDAVINYWNLYALAADYGVEDSIEVTLELTDEQLALRYSACDCTILPTAGEGFGYPIAESLACGTACITTDYAAGAELVSEACRVAPIAYRIDTMHNVRRAVLSGYGFADKANEQIEKKRQDWDHRGVELRLSVSHLDWNKLRSVWQKWFLEGIR